MRKGEAWGVGELRNPVICAVTNCRIRMKAGDYWQGGKTPGRLLAALIVGLGLRRLICCRMDGQSEPSSDSKPPAKQQVVRGARACTVCRAAKMKCVGAEDGQKQCQRCKRANVECIFEKHRRGRKPGSKLSEASKMLRRLEKGLNSAKLKTQPVEPGMSIPFQSSDAHSMSQDSMYMVPPEPSYVPATHFQSNSLPPLNESPLPPPPPPPPPPPAVTVNAYPPPQDTPRVMDMDDEDEDPDKSDTPPFPAKLIKQNQRNSFFRIILNAEEPPVTTSSSSNRGPSRTPPQLPVAPVKPTVPDPIFLGLITEKEASNLFEAVFIRLNPFINLFDPQLHTHTYVRKRCPFLFTTLIMAGAKFFKPEIFTQCQKLANELAFRAFQEAWKSVEVVQAFACLTYWRDPEDNRTWTYIGYACRMAVELGLNQYVATPPPETTLQKLERRNRERTYLVLFVHDRSLSTQTGRHWMLPENDDLIENSGSWHCHGVDNKVRPEDVIIAAFVELRRIAADITDVFSSSKGSGSNDINYEVVLRNCNAKLSKWNETWRFAMERANGGTFHYSFLSFFRLYVRVFLNYFGIASVSSGGKHHHSVQAHSVCFSSAIESLRIVTNDFTSLSMLRYGQETITVMTAYAAIILLKLLRSPTSPPEVVTTDEVYSLILRAAEAYDGVNNQYNNASVHARFLRSLVENDKHRHQQRTGGLQIDPRLQELTNSNDSKENSPTQSFPHQAPQNNREAYLPTSHLQHQTQLSQNEYYATETVRNDVVSPISGTGGMNTAYYDQNSYYLPGTMHATEQDHRYYKAMFMELGLDNPQTMQHPHQGSMAYQHQMHHSYGH